MHGPFDHLKQLKFWIPFFCFFMIASHKTNANEQYRPNTPSDLFRKTITDLAVRVQNAKVAYANYSALRRDFPELKYWAEIKIDQWILDNFAYINRKQLHLNGIRNTTIPIVSDQLKVYFIPPDYGRGAEVEAFLSNQGKTYGIGMADLKGSGNTDDLAIAEQIEEYRSALGDNKGLDKLRTKDHSDGLMSLGEAIAELTRQTAAQALFDIHKTRHGTNLQTIESYFVISLPFSIIKNHGQLIPAAIYGRQAHWGRDAGLNVPASIYTDEDGSRQRSFFDGAADFGGVLITDPSLAPLLGAHDKDTDPQNSGAWRRGHQVAQDFVNGDTKAVYRHLEETLAPIKTQLIVSPGPEIKVKGIAALIQALKSSNRLTRYQAIRVLSELHPIPNTDLLQIAHLLEHPDPEVQISSAIAIRVLGQQSQEVTDKIIYALTHCTTKAQTEVFSALKSISKPNNRIVTAAAQFLKIAKQEGLKLKVIEYLKGTKTTIAEVHYALAGLMNDPSPIVRSNVVDALATLKTSYTDIHVSLALALEDSSDLVRKDAMIALLSIPNLSPEAGAKVAAYTNSPDPELRKAAAFVLGSNSHSNKTSQNDPCMSSDVSKLLTSP